MRPLRVLEEGTDEAAASDRRDVLIFSGEQVHPVSAGENFVYILCELIKERLNKHSAI